MLLRLKVKNFLSFYEETVFDMFPNLKRTTFENHIYKDMEVPVLKQAAIYGANGSGKSNLLKAFEFIKSFATNNDFLKGKSMNFYKFRLASDFNQNPICISIEFYQQNIYLQYTIEINDKEIQKEELSVSGLSKNDNQVLFIRTGLSFTTPTIMNEEIKKAIEKLIASNPMSSILSLNNEFPVFSDERAKNAFNWFKNQLIVLPLRLVNSSLINQMQKRTGLLEITNHVFSKIGIGIEQLAIEQTKVNEVLPNMDNDALNEIYEALNKRLEKGDFVQIDNDKVLSTLEKENEEFILKRFIFKQIGINNYIGELGYESQSDGTARILNLIPALYDIIHNNCIYVIDEIENSIHPSLMLALMKFFSETQTKGQLIYTTHETELLNQQELMRPDEIWFTEKHNGATKLYSLNDFKEHNTINIKNGYMEGRYGAIPFIGNLSE